MKWRMEPQAARKLADGLAAAVVVAIPWSTSAAYILMGLWAIVAVPNTDPAEWRAVMKHPAAYLPVALVACAAIGMLWAAGVPWPQRLEGFGSLAKLLTIPVLLVQFRNSPRWHWVLFGFLASCTVLLALSWFQVVTGIKPLLRGGSTSYGVPVRDYIAQSQEFILCAIGLVYVAYMRLCERGLYLALGCVALAALFVANAVFVAPSRTGLVTFPLLLLILVAAHMRISYTLGIACAIVVACAGIWIVSPAVQKRILGIVTEVQDARTRHLSTSAGERVEYWTTSLAIVEAAPVIGHGTGSMRQMFEKVAAEARSNRRPTTNPHNQTLSIAIQLGLVGVAILLAMWLLHFLLFRVAGPAGWVGMAVVAQNVIGSLFNNHLTDFTQSWIYMFGVGVAGAMALRAGAPPDIAST
jgi:O-antigen ligase